MRLNKDLRAVIVANAMANTGFTEAVAALVKRYADFAGQCRAVANNGVKDSVLKRAEKHTVDKFPEKLLRNPSIFRTDNDMRLNLQGLSFNIHFNGQNGIPDNANLWLEYPRTIEAEYKYVAAGPTVITADCLIEIFTELESDKAQLNDRILTASQYVRGMVSSVQTTEKLLEVWPECIDFLPSDRVLRTGSNLPAIRVEDLNKIFKLPKVTP